MKSLAFLIPRSADAKQALRLRRLGLAALCYSLVSALMGVAWSFGAISTPAALGAAAGFVAINLGLYAAIRSGFNLRFEDPSLTRAQMLAAISLLMYFVYHMDDGRDIALFGCFLIALFGIFRLDTRAFALVTLYTLAAYALVINLLMHLRPQAIHDVHHEWMSWLGLAGFLPCFIMVVGHINALRRTLREGVARFRGLTEMTSDFFWESDAEHRLTDRASANRKVSNVSVFRKGAQIGERRWEIPYLSPDAAGWEAHRAVLDAHQPFREFEISRLGTDGSERHISLSGDPVFDDRGVFRGYRGVGSDITARKQSERALRDSERQLRVFADNIPAMTVSWDEHMRCRFASKVFTDFYGFAQEDVIGRHVREIYGEAVFREVEGRMLSVMQGVPGTYRTTHKRADGESRFLEIRLLPHLGEQGQSLGCFAVTLDITEHQLAEERLQRVAHHDSLTGLPNRLLFIDRLDQAIGRARREARKFALLYFDLNGFKQVNDALGHAAGDLVLKEVAARVRRLVRESDTVARVGGDEFTVILTDVAGREEAEAVAGKVIAALVAPFTLGGVEEGVEVGVSIGIAIYPADARDADALVKAADDDMYRAKQSGNRFPAYAG